MRGRNECPSIASALVALACAASSAAQAPLFPVESFSAPGFEFDLLAGDFDGDGRLDIVGIEDFVILADGAVHVRFGDGAGGFGPTTKIADVLEPRALAAADLNGDGAKDIVVAHDNSPPISTLAVFLGNGAGSFGPHVNYASGSVVTGVALADLDGDGDVDAAMANGTPSGLVTVALGDGMGAFALPTAQTCGFAPNGIALADLDGDGDLDAATSDAGSNTVSILRGDGAGSFAYPSVFSVPTSPTSIAIGDVHGDGKLDIAVGRTFLFFGFAGGVSVLAGDGTGSFGSSVDWLTGVHTPAVTAADLDSDGAADVIACGSIQFPHTYSGGVRVLLSDGSGGVRHQAGYVASWLLATEDVLAEDVDADSDLDLVAVGGPLSVLRGDGSGRFSQPHLLEFFRMTSGMAIADLDASGIPDIVLRGLESTSTAVVPSKAIEVLLAEQASGYAAPIAYNLAYSVDDVLAAELTGDGRVDVATAHGGSDKVSVLAGDGTGALLPAVSFAVGNSPLDAAAVDLNRDGTTDLVTANFLAGTVSVLKGTGGGSFSPFASYTSGAKCQAIALGDLNGDADPDAVVVRDVATPGTTVLLGNGSGGFGVPKHYYGHYPNLVELGDLDGDGDLDAAVALGTYELYVLLGNGLGAFGAPKVPDVELPGSGIDAKMNLQIADVDADGRADICMPMATDGEALVVFGQGAGNFGDARWFLAVGSAVAITASDVDGDARADIATVGPDGIAAVLRNVVPDPVGVSAFGTGTPGCWGTIGMTATTEPKVGAADFALVCGNAPPLVEGVCGISLAADLAGSDPLGLGLIVHLGGLAVGHVAFVPARTDPSGFGRAELPIPSDPLLGGTTVHAQCFFPTRPESACGAAGGQLVSSVGLALAIQP